MKKINDSKNVVTGTIYSEGHVIVGDGNSIIVNTPPKYKLSDEEQNNLSALIYEYNNIERNSTNSEKILKIDNEILKYLYLIDDWKRIILMNYDILGVYCNSNVEGKIIIEQAKRTCDLCEKHNGKYEIHAWVLNILFQFCARERNYSNSIIYLLKHLKLNQKVGVSLLDIYGNLAQMSFLNEDGLSSEKFLMLAINEADFEINYTIKSKLLVTLAQIQEENFKFKDSLNTIESIQNNYLDLFDSNFEAHISGIKETITWKANAIERLNYVNNVSLGESFSEYNGLRDFISKVNQLYFIHKLYVNNTQLAFAYDFWGRANYENILLGFRYFSDSNSLCRDNAVKVKVSSLFEIKHFLEKLLLYNDSIVFLWVGELYNVDTSIESYGSSDFMMALPLQYYPRLPIEGAKILEAEEPKGFAGVMCMGHYNLLPVEVLNFIGEEGKTLFEKGYFTIIPAVLGGYIGHQKNNLMDVAMDTYLKPKPIINIGDVNSTTYFNLPYIPKIGIPNLIHLLEENITEISSMRNAIRTFQDDVVKGRKSVSLLSGEITHEINILNKGIKKANSKLNIVEEPYGIDFIDLEKQLDSNFDKLSEIDEKLANDLKIKMEESPYLVFWKSVQTGKAWHIREDYLLKNDSFVTKPEWINHWLGGTYINKRFGKF